MSGRLETDILVVGGGMAGLAMTARAAAAGFSAICVEAGPMPSTDTAEGDKRTTAVLMPGVDTLRKTGAWDEIASDAQAMQGLRILDCGGKTSDIREDVLFEANELGDGPFGWNVENGKGRLVLASHIDARENATLMCKTTVVRSVTRRDGILVTLSSGETLRAKLIVGADGRRSSIREAAGIGYRDWEFGQKILACRVAHSEPHHGISTEMHHVGGPLTFAPLPGNSSGVVWMTPDAEAEKLIALEDEAFREALQERSQGVLGKIEGIENRAVWNSSITVATGLTAPRTALIAEAVHSFPPIGAQGFNTSLRDVETLSSLIEGAEDPGVENALKQYSRRRMPDIFARTAGIDLLNRSVLSSTRLVRDLRHMGLNVLGRTSPMKRFAMRVGMGG